MLNSQGLLKPEAIDSQPQHGMSQFFED